MRFGWFGFCVLCVACAATTPAPVPSMAERSASLVRFADPPPPQTSQDPRAFLAGAYRLDSRHTTVTWRVRHYGLSMFTARFDRERGELTFDPEHPEASHVDVTIAVDSVSTGVLGRNGERDFDNEIANVLGVSAHPEIRFASTSIDRTGPESGLLHGDLTLGGVTHPVTLDARFTGGDVKEDRGITILAFSARTTIRRSEFGIGPEWGADVVADDVEIIIEAEFGRTDPR